MKFAGMVLMASVCCAQQYEIGGAAGAGFAHSVSVTSPAGSAAAGFQPGAAFGGLLGHNLYSHLSGEVRYTYLRSNLKLSGSGAEPTFTGVAHALHYDLLLHPARKRGRSVLPFAAFGGGMKVYRGTGKEAAYQPLNRFAYLTRTQEVKAMASVGGGVKVSIGPKLLLRTEFRDYITPFPRKVIAPAPGAKVAGWVHDFVPMVGISYVF